MKHLLLLLLSSTAYAKTTMGVPPFFDRAEVLKCGETTIAAKPWIERELQSRLIEGMMRLERFQIREREIRLVKPKYTLVGSVRALEVCENKVSLSIEVQMADPHSNRTLLFTSTAQASSGAGRAGKLAVKAATDKIVKLVDDAIPRRAPVIRLAQKSSTPLPVSLTLIPRKIAKD